MTTNHALSPELIEELRTTVKGAVVGPADDTWQQERLAWHLLLDQRPAAVVHVQGVDDIIAAVTFAKQHGQSVAAQARGHGASEALNGTILIRTLGLTSVEIDEDARRARIEPGVRWGELNEVLTTAGLTGLPGSSGDTSVVGLSLGGGLSWFGRKYGQPAHYIHAVELVTADAEHVRVTKDSDPELFWAIRGGGGDFGIVTALEIDLLPTPQIYGGRLVFPIAQAKAMLNAFVAATRTAPDELSIWAWLMNYPDFPDLPAEIRGQWMAMLDVVYLGSKEEAEALLAPIKQAATPIVDGLGYVALNQIDKIANEPEDPMPGLMRSTLLNDFDEVAVDALLEVANPGHPSPLLAFEVRHLGGALARTTGDDGAAGVITEPFLLLHGGIVPMPELLPVVHGANDAVATAMAQWDSGRIVLNMMGEEPLEQVFPADSLASLRAIKQRRDPAGVIRSSHPFS